MMTRFHATPRRALEYLAWLALAAFFWGFSAGFADPDHPEVIAPHVWPRVFAAMVAVVATLHLIDECRRAAPEARAELADALRTALLFVAPVGYVLLMPRIGFYVATPFFLVAQLFLLGERRPLMLLGVAAGVAVAVTVAFTTLFYVALPVGTWPGFHDLNGAIVAALR